MKHSRTYNFLGCLALLLSVNSVAAAQTQKIGYVNTDIILSKMPAYKQAQQQLATMSQQWRLELKQMKQELEKLKKDFEAKKILYTDAIRFKKKQRIEQKIEARNQYRDEKFGPEGAYFQQQQKLLKPIQRKIYEAILVISQRKEVDFVFDRAQDTSLLFAGKQWNLNQEVLQELDLALND